MFRKVLSHQKVERHPAIIIITSAAANLFFRLPLRTGQSLRLTASFMAELLAAATFLAYFFRFARVYCE
jgi:hypothetical protein